MTSGVMYDLTIFAIGSSLIGQVPGVGFKKLANNNVLEILPPGRKLALFVDYLEFSVTHSELKDLFHDEQAHRDWLIPLGAAAGIYLILTQKPGDQYVGSAYGEGGISGRWRNYAISGSGGNILLLKLIESDSDYPQQFRLSVLQILPKTLARDEVFERETLYKRQTRYACDRLKFKLTKATEKAVRNSVLFHCCLPGRLSNSG